MSLNWNNLRSLNGSQANSFEELCCQLACSESVPAGSRFFRKGAPDAGVECYWRLPNGEEWGWQAKFFRFAPDNAQWQQIDGSIQTAIRKHPHLSRYTLCLPLDLPDARVGRSRSALQKWEDRVAKWESFSVAKGMDLSLEYWGQSQISTRFSEERHRGRLWFWFNETCLSNSWFQQRVEEALDNARDRYSRELDVELPLVSIFDALGRTPAFFDEIERLYSNARIKLGRLPAPPKVPLPSEDYGVVSCKANELFGKLQPWISHDRGYVEWKATSPIPWDEVAYLARVVRDAATKCISALSQARDARAKQTKAGATAAVDDLDWPLHCLRELRYAVSDIEEYSRRDECRVSNLPSLLLVGDAGQGKTHLLCHVTKREMQESRPRVLFHGEQFQNGEPWSQMIQLLGLNCSPDEFLGALEAAAQANRCRILLFIDALNEGQGNRLWWKFLPGMLTRLCQSPWLGICVSVRSSYERPMIPETLNDAQIVRVEHPGFGDLTYEAAARFFAHFGIEPSVPLLLPEFNNPLFLKLFCQSMQNEGLTRVPQGMHGVTAIFDFFIRSIDGKLSRVLNYDVRSRLVAKAVRMLADQMADHQDDRLPMDEAKRIVDSLLPRHGYQESLFRHLESEGLLNVVPSYRRLPDAEWTEFARFAYQRLSDHLITQRLLDRYLDKEHPATSFTKDRPLGKLVGTETACQINGGILGALAIQIPEMTKAELPDLAPYLTGLSPMREAFVESVIWRHPTSFTPDTNRYINEQVLRYKGTSKAFLSVLVSLASIPNHPFNADRLHTMLSRLDVPERDSRWSIFLHEQWGRQGAVDRLVAWAWQDTDKSAFEDEVIRLAGITLAWFFTTANRFLRDRATKAMVRLCENRIQILTQIFERFADVNDPYVSERLYAVAYGCAMRTRDKESLARLATGIYRLVFESGRPPPHILLRDYARGVIEVALHKGISLSIDVDKIRPPYRSHWPKIEVPTSEELERWGERKKGMPDKEWARVHLYDSVTGKIADFSRYVIGDLDEWSSERIQEPRRRTHEELHDDFVKSLTTRQKDAWDKYRDACEAVEFYRRLDADRRRECLERDITDAQLDAVFRAAEQRFVRTIGANSAKSKLFREAIVPYLCEPHKYYREYVFDGALARRWMMQRIIDMGWSVERFGEFDRDVNRFSDSGRDAHKPERIGKKYQWIAYYEFLARISDNFRMRRGGWSSGRDEYHGPWDVPFRRDIDPSCVLRRTQRDQWRDTTSTWWAPVVFNSWEEPAGDAEWLQAKSGLPPLESLIEVVCPDDGTCWFTLDASYQWREAPAPDEEEYDQKRRELRYALNCYLVAKNAACRLLEWAREGGWSRRLPESGHSHDIFLGEFFWSQAFRDQDSPYYSRDGWTRGQGGAIPAEVLVANDGYLWESSGFDCSVDESVSIKLPCRILAEGLGLDWGGIEGKWYDRNGQLVASDPSVNSAGPSVLLLRKEPLAEFLASKGLTLSWVLSGEKQILCSTRSGEYRGRLEINGAYVLDRGRVSGETRVRFIAPGAQ